MIVGDRDGVVVVPLLRIDDVISKLDEVFVLEKELDARVADGLQMPEFADEIINSDRTVWVD